jgi:molybdate transport system substrate-binding protein
VTATLRLLSAGSIRRGVSEVIALFEQASGARVEVVFTSAPKVRQRLLAGERWDVALASTAALDALAAGGCLDTSTRIRVGSTPMAVAMRTGLPVPDLSTIAAFTAAMRAAHGVACNEGSSGLHALQVIERLGLRDRPGPEIFVCASGAEVFQRVAASDDAVYGLVNVTNIADAVASGAPVRLAALLPAGLQNVTTYGAAVVSGCAEAVLGARFVAIFATPPVRRLFSDAGVE